MALALQPSKSHGFDYYGAYSSYSWCPHASVLRANRLLPAGRALLIDQLLPTGGSLSADCALSTGRTLPTRDSLSTGLLPTGLRVCAYSAFTLCDPIGSGLPKGQQE